jgi:hypothetical protein
MLLEEKMLSFILDLGVHFYPRRWVMGVGPKVSKRNCIYRGIHTSMCADLKYCCPDDPLIPSSLISLTA